MYDSLRGLAKMKSNLHVIPLLSFILILLNTALWRVFRYIQLEFVSLSRNTIFVVSTDVKGNIKKRICKYLNNKMLSLCVHEGRTVAKLITDHSWSCQIGPYLQTYIIESKRIKENNSFIVTGTITLLLNCFKSEFLL